MTPSGTSPRNEVLPQVTGGSSSAPRVNVNPTCRRGSARSATEVGVLNAAAPLPPISATTRRRGGGAPAPPLPRPAPQRAQHRDPALRSKVNKAARDVLDAHGLRRDQRPPALTFHSTPGASRPPGAGASQPGSWHAPPPSQLFKRALVVAGMDTTRSRCYRDGLPADRQPEFTWVRHRDETAVDQDDVIAAAEQVPGRAGSSATTSPRRSPG